MLISPNNKIFVYADLLQWRQKIAQNHQKLVMTNGCFDLLHRGHVDYLFRSRQQGDFLLVLLNADSSVRQLKGPSRPINNENDRAFVLGGLACVDAVFIFTEPRCTKWITEFSPDIYIKGADYNLETINGEEKEALIKAHTEIRFLPFVQGFSTTSTLKKISS